jgi:hypothetical protein
MLTLYVCRFEIKFLSMWKSKTPKGVVHLIAVWTERISDITYGGTYYVLNILPSLMPVMYLTFKNRASYI